MYVNQEQVLGWVLDWLVVVILVLWDGLGLNWLCIIVLVMIEFGCMVCENGFGGMDYGIGGVMLMVGGVIWGGCVYGDWLGLGEGQFYVDCDLMFMCDICVYVVWVMCGLFGVDCDMLECSIFLGLDLGGDLKMLV